MSYTFIEFDTFIKNILRLFKKQFRDNYFSTGNIHVHVLP